MRAWRRTNQFKKDVKLAKKRGKGLAKLEEVLDALIEGKPLDAKFKDHALRGNFADCRECKVEPDWLLIYRMEPESAVVFERTGTHSDLFD